MQLLKKSNWNTIAFDSFYLAPNRGISFLCKTRLASPIWLRAPIAFSNEGFLQLESILYSENEKKTIFLNCHRHLFSATAVEKVQSARSNTRNIRLPAFVLFHLIQTGLFFSRLKLRKLRQCLRSLRVGKVLRVVQATRPFSILSLILSM